jgi:hypothetical protein
VRNDLSSITQAAKEQPVNAGRAAKLDAIIIGGGRNGLLRPAYLAKVFATPARSSRAPTSND